MMTYYCADTTARRPRWRHLGTTTGPDDEVTVRIAPTDGHLRRHQTTTLGPALGAVTAFLTDGRADPALTWSDDDPDGELPPRPCRSPTATGDPRRTASRGPRTA